MPAKKANPAAVLAEKMMQVLRQRPGDAAFLTLGRLAEIADPSAGSRTILAVLYQRKVFAAVAARRDLDAPVALLSDLPRLAASPQLLEFALKTTRTAANHAFSIADLKKKLTTKLQVPFAEAVQQQIQQRMLPVGVGWILIKNTKRLFLVDDVHIVLVSRHEEKLPPPVPAPRPERAPLAFSQAFDDAFARLDRAAGGHNFVSLAELRPALGVDRSVFDAGLREMRRAGQYTLSAAEGRHGLGEAERAAGVTEDGTLLLYVSRENTMIATNGAVMAGSTGLDDLVRQILAGNPFTDNRVNGPAAGLADAHHIHRAGFERLTALALEARDQRRGLGAVLWGEAGIGKSHVLARLGRWAEEENRACFVYLHNLQASPEGLPRSLLKTVVSILTNGWVGRLHRTPLFRLVAHFALEAFGYPPDGSPSWPEIGRAYFRLVDQESARGATHAALADRTVYSVLLRFFHSAYAAKYGQRNDGEAALAVRWLSGDFLDPAEAERLHLPPASDREEPVRLADNQQIKAVLVAFCRLALAARQPFLLCFDQADNLDDAQMAALARFLEALIDAAPNLLVVTAGIQSSLLHWRTIKIIQDSAWDRLAQFEVRLQRVTPAEAERIVAARIAGSLGALCERDPLRGLLANDPLFPLGRTWRTEFFGDRTDLRPRDVLNWAREGWRREQQNLILTGGAEWLSSWGQHEPTEIGVELIPTTEEMQKAVDRRITRQIEEQQAQRRAHPETLPPDGERLLGLIHSLLEQCRQVSPDYSIVAVEQQPGKPATRRSFDLLLRRRSGDWEQVVRLLVVVTAASVTAAGCLRRLLKAITSPGQVVLVTDQRRPLPLGLKGQEYLNKLKQGSPGSFRHVELTFADVATLDALQAVVGLARSSDLELEIGGRSWPLSEAEVLAALHRLGRYRSAPLLRDLLGPPS